MSTYSPILRTELIAPGDQAGSWGTTTNQNYQYVFEQAIAGYQIVSVTSASQALTYVNGITLTPASNQSIYALLKLTTSTSANFAVYAPPVSKQYVIWNSTAYVATFYNSTVIGNTTAAGSGIAVPAGKKVLIWSDGTNFYGNDAVAGDFAVPGNETIGGTLAVTGASTFVGIPSGPTAALNTNTTQLATTAFVANEVAGISTTGRIVQSVSSTSTTVFSTTSGSFVTTGHTASITPSSASSKILCLVTAELAQTSTNLNTHMTLFRDSTNLAGSGNAFCNVLSSAGNIYANAAINFLDSPSSTSALTYSTRILVNGGTGVYNAGGTGVTAGVASIVLLEIL